MIKNQLRIIHACKESREKVTIPYSQVRKATGIAESTISQWMRNEVTFFSMDVLEKFCRYYEVKPGDILVLEG